MGKVKKLKKQVRELKKLLGQAQGNRSATVSPLAPKGGFPDLPVIKGVTFSAIEAGVRYSGRTDVMLAQLCAGTSIAGVFTKSATRAAPVKVAKSIIRSGDCSLA